jgi:hypothetical protein
VDAAELKRLERFTDPGGIYKSYRELENKIASGEFKPQLRKDATADETARWRAESGIPLKAEDYKVNMTHFSRASSRAPTPRTTRRPRSTAPSVPSTPRSIARPRP